MSQPWTSRYRRTCIQNFVSVLYIRTKKQCTSGFSDRHLNFWMLYANGQHRNFIVGHGRKGRSSYGISILSCTVAEIGLRVFTVCRPTLNFWYRMTTNNVKSKLGLPESENELEIVKKVNSRSKVTGGIVNYINNFEQSFLGYFRFRPSIHHFIISGSQMNGP